MKTKASIIVMSHLSDAQEICPSIPKNAILNINFAKFIILECKGNLNQEIDPDIFWEKFLNR
jgi:hypothetical protein